MTHGRSPSRAGAAVLDREAWRPAGSQAGTEPAWLTSHPNPIPSSPRAVDILVIGAGAAGISAAAVMERAGLRGYADGIRPAGSYLVLDAEVRPGGSFQHLWRGLTVGRARAWSDEELPGADDEPVALALPRHLTDIEEVLDLPVLRPVFVDEVHRGSGGGFIVTTTSGTWHASGIINATGRWTRPFLPSHHGTFSGRELHTQEYTGPADFSRRRCAVIGGGAAACEHVDEISRVAKQVRWYAAQPASPRVAQVMEELAARKNVRLAPAPAGLTRDGIEEADGTLRKVDAIIWATGFRPELRHLAPLKIRKKKPLNRLYIIGRQPRGLGKAVSAAEEAARCLMADLALV
ncbi:MAG: NAD(P)-binding domain-containing protein [Flaviflexus sp.]|nr:NAD(P)-binding domain-containing protein [Flaviflexus sp.]